MRYWAFFRFALACALICLPHGLAAGTLHISPGAIQSLKAGFFCLYDPDDTIKAPNSSTGELQLYNSPFDFVHLGDKVPSIPGIGVGIVVRMDNFRAGEELTVTAAHGDPCCGQTESWKARPRQDGLIWLGYLGEENKDFIPGEWQFSVLRGQTILLTYSFHVVPPAEVPLQARVCSMLLS